MHVCVCEGGRERERQSDSVCVCVCVCMCVFACVYVRAYGVNILKILLKVSLLLDLLDEICITKFTTVRQI